MSQCIHHRSIPSNPHSSIPVWNYETDYPVYHDVLFYNPDVRKFVVSTLTGRNTRPEVVITPSELVELLTFLEGN